MAGHQRNISSLIWWPIIVTYLIDSLYKITKKSQNTNMKGGMANGVDLTGLLGGHKRLGVWGRKSPSGAQGWNPGRGPKAEAFL